MSAVLLAATGALFTGFASLAFGLIVVRLLALEVTRLEELTFAFFMGSAGFSLVVFALTLSHLAYAAAFVCAGCLFIAAFLVRFRRAPRGYTKGQPLPKLWLIFAGILCFRYVFLYLSHALGPEYSYDGSTYHLALVARYLREHHFPMITNNMYADFPEGLEMLFLSAFSIGLHSAASTTHLLFAFATGALIVSFGQRFHLAKAGIGASVLFFLAPITGYDATVAYNDIALAGACFLTFYALQIWASNQSKKGILIVAGIAAGFAGAIKYTGFIAVLYAAGFVLWRCRRDLRRFGSAAALLALPAFLLISPWLIKNAIEMGNPVSPFANRIFPNRYVHISLEDSYRQQMAHYNGVKLSEIPMEVTVNGSRLQGLIGPVFLLVPIALFALSSPMGRQILLAFAVFLVPYFGNIGTRFLFPCFPMLCLAFAMVLASWPLSLGPVLLLHFLVSWPPVIDKFTRYSLSLERSRWDETLRQTPEEQTLTDRLPGYGIASYIREHLPPQAKIFQFGGVPGAYMPQEIDDFYEGAKNERAAQLLFTGVSQRLRTSVRKSFHFTPTQLKALRVEQTASSKEEIWKIAELHLTYQGVELPSKPGWHLRSNVYPWDVHLAMDHDPLTVWESWQHLRPGMFFEVEFDTPTEVDSVSVDTSPDQDAVRMVIKGRDASGRPLELTSTPAARAICTPEDWRKRVGAHVKALGYGYLVIDKNGLLKEIENDPAGWGMKVVAERDPYILFQIE